MTRACCLAFILLATVAAGPPSPLPVPPIPPLHPPMDQSAPLPNPDIEAPPTEASQGPQFSLHDFRVNHFTSGMGYTPGSQFEASEEKRAIQTPGVAVKVPLQ